MTKNKEAKLDIDTAHPVIPELYSKPNKMMLFHFRKLAEKVVAACIMKHGSQDLLMHVYMSGVYHGATLERASNNEPNASSTN